MEELKDIKGLVDVPDDSLMHLLLSLGGGVLLIVLLLGLLWWRRKPKRRRQRISPQERAKAQLQAIDFADTKESVYAFSEATQQLNPHHQGLQELLKELEQYKYQREVPRLSEEHKASMKKIIKEITDANES